MAVLSVEKLQKSFGSLRAVWNVSFSVSKGKCFGLLGPNGAGKSTTLEMIQGIISPDAGKILFNHKSLSKKTREDMGVQFQSTALPPKLTTLEVLRTFARFYQRHHPIDEVITLCQLNEFKDRRHELLSGGQKQRLLLAIALCHDPALVLLDEPTTGLDPQARRHVWDIVQLIKKAGKTVMLTTHYMDEAEQLCDEIAIMDHGCIIAQGSPRKLLYEHCQQVVITLPSSVHQQRIEGLSLPGTVLEVDHGLEIKTQDLNSCLKLLSNTDLNLNGINVRQSNLDDLFLQLTGKELRT